MLIAVGFGNITHSGAVRETVTLPSMGSCLVYCLPLQRPGDFVIAFQPVGERRRRVFRDFPASTFQPVLELDVKLVNVVTEKSLLKLLAFAGVQFA